MKRLKNITKNFSSYEICFIGENIFMVLLAITCLSYLSIDSILLRTFLQVQRFLGDILTVFLFLQNIIIDGKSEFGMKVLYIFERYIILPVNTVKTTIFLGCNIALFIEGYISIDIFTCIMLLSIFYIAHLKYYLNMLKIRKGILNNEQIRRNHDDF